MLKTLNLSLIIDGISGRLILMTSEMNEAIGALLARMVTLATEIATSPQTWNEHIAPVLLRSMVDAYITLAWIFNDPLDRSRKFILYGLGQAKLGMEHRKVQLEADGIDPNNDLIIKATESWINSQRYTFLTEIDSWRLGQSEIPGEWQKRLIA